MSGLDEAVEALEALGKQQQNLTQGIKHLRAVEEWALAQQPVKDGDKVTLKSSFVSPPPPGRGGNGWSAYHEALVPGATGVVREVSYNGYHHYWGAEVRLDVEWYHSGDLVILSDDPHLFYINVRHLRPRRKSDKGLTAPEGAQTWRQRSYASEQAAREARS
jgi:hypothetical protein